MSSVTGYRIPEKGDVVRLDVPPTAVGLHGKVREGDRLTVEGTAISDASGLVVKVRPYGSETTFRLRHDHVRPVDAEHA